MSNQLTTWKPGFVEIKRLLASGDLVQVSSSKNGAENFIAQAERSLKTAALAFNSGDIHSASDLIWTAARKSLTAVLLAQGLAPSDRAGGKGVHLTVLEAANAQIFTGTRANYRELASNLRRTRRDAEYKDMEGTLLKSADISNDLVFARTLFEICLGLSKEMPNFNPLG